MKALLAIKFPQYWGIFVLSSLVHHFTTVNPLLSPLSQISPPPPHKGEES